MHLLSIQDGTATALRMRRTPQRSTQIRSAASGRVLWSTENIGFEPVPRELLEKTTSEIRTRKGMKPEPYDANYYAG